MDEWKYIRDFDLDRVVQECLPYLKAVNLLDDDTIHAKMDWIKKIIASVWEAS